MLLANRERRRRTLLHRSARLAHHLSSGFCNCGEPNSAPIVPQFLPAKSITRSQARLQVCCRRGNLPVTTVPAPTTQPSPNSTSFRIIIFAPIQHRSPMRTFPNITGAIAGAIPARRLANHVMISNDDAPASIDHHVLVKVIPYCRSNADSVVIGVFRP